MPSIQRRAVVGDIGGTYCRFGIADLDELKIDHFMSFESEGFRSLEQVVGTYLRSVPHHPKTISLAIAGPVIDGAVEMTNLPWATTATRIRDIACAKHVCLINDFEALALALPHLGHQDAKQIGGTVALPHGTRLVMGPGTGLGVAALTWTGRNWISLSGEGAHVGFSAQSDEEFGMVRRLARDVGYVTAEHLISGSGLVRTYRMLYEQSGSPSAAPEIVRMAIVDGDPRALRCVRLFSTWLARLAADLAILFGARGGIFIAGGIAPRIYPFLSDGNFRAAFEARGPLSDYLAEIPVFVIQSQDAGLKGAALALANMREQGQRGELDI